MKITLADALAGLPLEKTEKWPLGVWDAQVFTHGSMSVSIFAPKEKDFQTPHDQDELYIIVSGGGTFTLNGANSAFEPGDVLFAPAGAEHHFTHFSPDFAAWVVFC
jgi:mannose-6-phosphate isomerase-like protein (cupin superfamily)